VIEHLFSTKGAAVDANITTLYNKVDSYATEDRWHFDLPL
jgi:hypothetical protein